jgi:hypothetical protein
MRWEVTVDLKTRIQNISLWNEDGEIGEASETKKKNQEIRRGASNMVNNYPPPPVSTQGKEMTKQQSNLGVSTSTQIPLPLPPRISKSKSKAPHPSEQPPRPPQWISHQASHSRVYTIAGRRWLISDDPRVSRALVIGWGGLAPRRWGNVGMYG